jgi:hypothetical protein
VIWTVGLPALTVVGVVPGTAAIVVDPRAGVVVGLVETAPLDVVDGFDGLDVVDFDSIDVVVLPAAESDDPWPLEQLAETSTAITKPTAAVGAEPGKRMSGG